MRSVCLLVLILSAWRLLSAEPSSPTNAVRRLVILGDSLAAGYGVQAGESWPDRLQARIQKAALPFTVINAGVSGDTTAGGLRRIDWVLRQPVDVLILELGGNDGLRGIPPASTRSNLLGIVRKTREKWPSASIVLAGMQMPPSMGRGFAESFQKVFPEVASSERLHLIPHILEGVGGVPELNQPDLIHPTPAGHDLLASNVWTTVEPLLRQLTKPAP